MASAPKITRILDQNTNVTVDESRIIEGNERRGQFYNEPMENNTYLPLGVKIEDIDKAVVNYIKNEMEFHTKEVNPPIFDFNQQRFDEGVQSWLEKHEDESYKLPFVAITKDYSTNFGTNFKNLRIPSEISWSIYKVPKMDTQGKIIEYDSYKIPMPLNVDMNYYIEVFCNNEHELNVINERILYYFGSAQLYIKPNNHTMAMYLDDLNDKTQTDVDKRRYYHHVYKIIVKGYLLNSDNFIKLNTINSVQLNFKLGNEDRCKNIKIIYYDNLSEKCKMINFIYKRNEINVLSLKVRFDKTFEYSNFTDNDDFIIKVNDEIATLPFDVLNGDVISVTYTGELTKTMTYTLY